LRPPAGEPHHQATVHGLEDARLDRGLPVQEGRAQDAALRIRPTVVDRARVDRRQPAGQHHMTHSNVRVPIMAACG
jgi:hypothetical protein